MSNYTELLYMWVGCNKTGFIMDQGFNFSPSYTFALNERQNQRFELTCKVNDNYPNVWKNRNIVGLTALVGKNGTGKSTLMNCLLEPSAQERILLVYKCGITFHIKHNLGDVRIDHDMDRWRVRVSNQLSTDNDQIRISITNAMGSAKSTVDEELGSYVFSPDTDISGYFQTVPIDEPSEPEAYRLDGLRNLIPCTDFDKLAIIGYYRHWHKSDPDHPTLLSMNSTLNISFSDKFQMLIKKMMTKHNTSSGSRYIRNQLREMLTISKKNYFGIDPFPEGYMALGIEMCYVTDQWDLLPHILCRDPAAVVYDLADQCGMNPKFRSVAEYFHDSIIELENLKELLSCFGYSIEYTKNMRTDNVRISFADNPETYKAFCDYIWRLTKKKDSFVLRYLTIDMPQLSSGEKALQNICSWLHLASTVGNMRGSGRSKKTILLLLDEVDLYMHPEWQRKFLDFLSEELLNQFSESDIQIVLTTHSPLVLSDIPCGNIIYLQNVDFQCMIDEDGDFKESFGASIPTLLKDSFFMNETIGEFAKKKITEVVNSLDALKQEPENPDLRKQCFANEKTIEIIGDQMIRHKLRTRYRELMYPESKYQDPSHAVREWLNMADSDQKKEMKQKILAMLSAIDDN